MVVSVAGANANFMKNKGVEQTPILIDMDNNIFRIPEHLPCKYCGGNFVTTIKKGRVVGLCSNHHRPCGAKSSRSPTILSSKRSNVTNLYMLISAYTYVVEKWNANN